GSSSVTLRVLGSAFGNCHRRRQLARVRHREIDGAGADSFGPRLQASRQLDAGLRPARDLDLEPREGASDAEAERLADRLLAGEASRVVLRRIRPRVAVGTLGLREAALPERRIAL